MMNNNNTNNNTNNMNRRVGDQDLNPLTGLNNPFQVQSNPMNGGFGGNLVGPNNPMFNNSNVPSGVKPQQFIPPPGARFDPIYPTGPFGGVGNGGNRGGSSYSFGNINPDHHKPPQFGDDDF